jgi:hypothetical protein
MTNRMVEGKVGKQRPVKASKLNTNSKVLVAGTAMMLLLGLQCSMHMLGERRTVLERLTAGLVYLPSWWLCTMWLTHAVQNEALRRHGPKTNR